MKIIFTLAFILFLNLVPFRAWIAYLLFLGLSFSAALLSRLGLWFILKRAFLAVPFVLGAFPLIFTGPSPLATVNLFNSLTVTYSPSGAEHFASIAVRSWISVQAAILLAATTRFPDLLVGLQQLKVPKLFVAMIGLMWRYLFVIGEEVASMLRARASRSAVVDGVRRSGGSLAWRAGVAGGMAGSLFLRSIERSDRVYAAMLSRGYNGELPSSEADSLKKNDQIILVLGLVFLGLLWLVGLWVGG